MRTDHELLLLLDCSFSLGITLDRLQIRGVVISPDGGWEPKSVKGLMRFFNKTLEIGKKTQRTTSERGARSLQMYVYVHE